MSTEMKSFLGTSELEAELERLRHQEMLLDATEQAAQIGHCDWDYETGLIKSCLNGYAGTLQPDRCRNNAVPEFLGSDA